MEQAHIEFLLLLTAGIAAGIDALSRRIPNALVAAGIAAAFMLHLFAPAGAGFGVWALGALTGFSLFLPFYILRGMAAGDVKLMAAVGSFAGPLLAFKIAMAAFLAGGVWALIVVILKRRGRETLVNLLALALLPLARGAGTEAPAGGMPIKSVGRLPYGVAIFLGTVILIGAKYSQWLGKIVG